MKAYSHTKQLVTHNTILAVTAGLLTTSCYLSADTDNLSHQPAPNTSPLNLSLPQVYTAAPPAGVQYDLAITRNIHQGSLDNIKSRKIYALGLQRVKADKSMRVRGWELKEDLYFGQTVSAANGALA